MVTLLDRLNQIRALRRWRRAAREAGKTPLSELRKQRHQANQIRTYLNQLIHVADSRLALPLIGSSVFPKPHGTDWHWRPQLWRGPLPQPGASSVETRAKLGDEITLFHDCEFSELTLRQLRNTKERDLAPFGLRMDVFRFDGSFLSLALDLPKEAANGLTRSHLIRLDTIIDIEKPLEIFARLNIRHGPNTEQLVRELPLHEKNVMVEFDLAYSRMNEKRIEQIWLDLIFEAPDMNQLVIRDLTFARHRRASF